jgi:predicted MPP superfamily phosphohydrolase
MEARFPINTTAKSILLMHYPAQVKRLGIGENNFRFNCRPEITLIEM